MSTVATQAPITPEQLEMLPDANNFELVDGELVERNVSIESSEIAVTISCLLKNEAKCKNEAHVFANDLGYQCYPGDAKKIRKPDASVVRSERFFGINREKGYMPIHADLVVEVISPNDSSYEVSEKVREYLAAGFPLVWVVHPNVRTVTVYSADRHIATVYQESDEITAAPALSEFRCKVSAFFE